MPINGLSEDVRIPRLGKMHLGIKVPVIKDGKPVIDKYGSPVMRPEKTDYFVLDPQYSGYKDVVRLFGEKPKQLRILIPVEDEDVWREQYLKMYDITHGLICKGTGGDSPGKATRRIDIKTGELPTKTTETVDDIPIPCPGYECSFYKERKCHERMNLRFILPEVPGLGIWQIDTGSKNSILNINSCALMIGKAFGRITTIPLLLTIEPMDVTNPETGKKQKAFVLNLRSTVTLAQLADVAREQSKQFLLEPPDWEEVMEQKAAEDIETLYGDGEPKATEKPAAVVESPESKAAFDGLKSANEKPPAAEPEKKETGKFQQAEPATNQPEVINGVNMKWLQESLKTLNWKRVIVDYLKPQFGCLSAKVSGCLLEMKEEQVNQFTTEIKDRLKMMEPEPPPDNIPF